MTRVMATALIATLAVLPATTQASKHRWYDDSQVQTGESLYTTNCVICHGERGAATENWRQRGADGHYPPPPLNGTAHTWHHDLKSLRRSIREGGVPLGGVMPGFAAQLDDDDIAALIAYIQSLWPQEVYEIWARSYPDDAEHGMTAIDQEQSYTDPPKADDDTGADLSVIDRLARALRNLAGVN
jgi:mono/diheme cytochrome c family protein